jgi:cysteinyl-tRNA synthetase
VFIRVHSWLKREKGYQAVPVLSLYNSLTRKKEVFQPLDPSHVRVYACGPTVYDFAHIGNARMAAAFDLLVQVLRSLYPNVTYVSNITDVDDKIMAAAAASNMPIAVVTEKFTRIYNEDMASLGVQIPDVQPRATEHIGEMIAMIEALIERGHAYVALDRDGSSQGTVLFNVPSFPAYGGLSGRSRDDQIAGARVEVAPFKRDPADFVLWKPSTPDQPGWDSPWGRGRPGWHIECSAMAEKHLGLPFDIHGGGADLKFPHHENEIAQSCCAHGHENDLSAFARTWVHNGFVTVEGEKMSKSLGNFTLAHDLIRDWPGEVLRLALLSAHYRAPLDWTNAVLVQSKNLLDGFYRTLMDIEVEAANMPVPPAVMAALLDDLNTAGALTALKAIEKKAAAAKTETEKATFKGQLLAGGRMLGLLQADPAAWLGYGQSGGMDAGAIDQLLRERQQARANRDFKRADEIRDILAAQNIVIEDTPEGPKWRQAG